MRNPKRVTRIRFAVPSTDVSKLPEFVARARPLKLSISLHNEKLGARHAYWRIADNETHAVVTTGFDVDVEAAFKQCEMGIRLGFVSLYSQSTASRPDGTGRSPTGGPSCVVCDAPGGLPCPAMVKQALASGIKLAYPPGDARLVPNHVHPGRCRKRLRQWLTGAVQLSTGKVRASEQDT